LYKGNILPLKENSEEPYYGEVVGVGVFDGDMDEQLIVTKIIKF